MSRTVTVTETDAHVEVVKLQTPERKKSVRFDESAVDNEFSGQKTSKSCCIYHRPLDFGESESESDSGGC